MAKRSPDPVTAYASGVVAKKIVAGPYVRAASARHLSDRKRKDLDWRPDRAQKAIDFFREMLVLEDGAAFVLLDWQQFVVGSCFGWYNREGFRRFRTAYVETGKGSGKTPLAAGIGLYGLVADGEPAPEVYSAATQSDQAKIVWKDAWRMVKANPELDALIDSPDRVDVQIGSLTIPGDMATFRPVSAEHRGLDGKRVHVALVDELHEHPTAMVVDKMRAGTKRRRNALIFEITNSGFDRTSVCWAHHELSVKVVSGLVENDAWFAYVCALDPCKACHESGKQFPSCEKCDDWRDERVWPKVNPGLGKVLPIAYLREQVEDANGMPSKENIVKRLNFCVWTENEERWLDMTAWDACPTGAQRLEDYAGRDCMAGLDASSTNDLFALALDFAAEDGFHDVVMRFWIPEETITSKESRRSEHDRLLLRQWVDEGWIRATPGNVVDYDLVESDVLADLARVSLGRISFDRWGVTQLVTHLKDKLGEERVIDFAQSMAGMTAPAKELERIVREGKLRHGGNPVLRWMASNVALQYGPNEQIKPDRKRSGEKIDGIIALIEALDGTMRKPNVVSIYDQRVGRGEEVMPWV